MLLMSEALLAKWFWRYGEEKEHLRWKKVVEKYEDGDRWWKPEVRRPKESLF